MTQTHKEFAKIFTFDDIGQVLIYCGQNDEGDPAIISIIAGNDMAQPSIKSAYPGDGGEEKRDARFALIDETQARFIGEHLHGMLAWFDDEEPDT
jgi:hypothetical protein